MAVYFDWRYDIYACSYNGMNLTFFFTLHVLFAR